MINTIVSIVIGLIFGAFVWFFLVATFSISNVSRFVETFVPILVAIVVCVAFIGITCPIHTEETTETATITKMEETALRNNATRRHIYVVKQDGEAICLNASVQEYATLSVEDEIEISKVETKYLLGYTTTEYDLSSQ